LTHPTRAHRAFFKGYRIRSEIVVFSAAVGALALLSNVAAGYTLDALLIGPATALTIFVVMAIGELAVALVVDVTYRHFLSDQSATGQGGTFPGGPRPLTHHLSYPGR